MISRYSTCSIILAVSVSLSLIGCARKPNKNSHIHAAQLFEKSLVLLRAYTDSLSIAKDSAHVESLARAYESKINAINFEFPPETDLRLTQEENDSLIKMTDRLVAARRDRLKYFASPHNDSTKMENTAIHNDSTTPPPSHNQHN
ncbi:MAG: hypothetical protein K2J78_01190 [Muribaculaceae bacterium]|nr:hypothetical protein [Muribaculaceae bacterium]